MARAKRHYLPGHIWHITHRCHKREFLLRFSKDRNRWLQRPRRKNVLIDYEKFMELLGTDNYDQAKRDHLGWAAEFLGNGNGWDDALAESAGKSRRGRRR